MVSVKIGWRLFTQLDYLAPHVTLNVSGSSGFKTSVGALLSICALVIFTLTSYIIMYTYFRTDNPQVTQELRSEDEYPKIDMLHHRLLPIIYPYLDDVIPVKNDVISTYATFLMSKSRYVAVTKDDGSQEIILERFIMEYKPCGELLAAGKDQLHIPSPDAGFIHQMTKSYGLCADYHETETYIKGRITDDIYEDVSFEVYPCSLDDPSQCVNADELARLSFIYALGSVNMDLANKEKPLKPRIDADDYYYININSGVQYQSRMMQTSIWDDEGYFFGTSIRDSYFSVEKTVTSMATRDGNQLYCTRQQIKDRTCDWFYFFVYISGGKEVRVTRSYKEFVSTMGDIGGTIEFVYLVVFALYKLYNDHHRKLMMVEQIYNLRREPNRPSCFKRKHHPNPRAFANLQSPESDGPTKLHEKAPAKVIDGAFELIEAKLDAVTLIKQLNELTVITKHLLKEHHMALIPAISLELEWSRSKILTAFRPKSRQERPEDMLTAMGQLTDRKDPDAVDHFFGKLLTDSWVGHQVLKTSPRFEGANSARGNMNISNFQALRDSSPKQPKNDGDMARRRSVLDIPGGIGRQLLGSRNFIKRVRPAGSMNSISVKALRPQ